MGSVKAFASGLNGEPQPRNGLPERDGLARPRKRFRLSETASAAIQTECAQSETSLEVDHMILDYMAYQTIDACFASRVMKRQSDSSRSLASNLTMSNTFVSIFKSRHTTYQPDADLRLRIALLKLATLFTQRSTYNATTPPRSALKSLRATNQDRARSWIGNADRIPSSLFDTTALDHDLPTSLKELERNRAHVLNGLDLPPEDEIHEDAHYGTSLCLSLLDLLPLFMQVSAVSNAMNNSSLTSFWMQLACEFMLQACLEQYLVFGAQGSDAVDEAFAWGYKDGEHDDANVDGEEAMSMDKNEEINDMFENEVYSVEVDGWASTKASYVSRLFPDASASVDSPSSVLSSDEKPAIKAEIVDHLENLAAQHPIATFEALLLKFLAALSKSIPAPVLVQLQHGHLDGMSELETKEFLADCHLSPADFSADEAVIQTAFG